MGSPDLGTLHVQRRGSEDIDQLIQQLLQHDQQARLLSAKLRCTLLLLRDGVNSFPYSIFTSGGPQDLAVAVITRTAPDFSVLSVYARDDPSSLAGLEAVLRSDELRSSLWQGTFRADAVTSHLESLLKAVCAEYACEWQPIVTLQQFARPETAASIADADCQPASGLAIRPLDLSHMDTVRRSWPYAPVTPDATAHLQDGLRSGISVGVFVSADSPVTATASTPPQAETSRTAATNNEPSASDSLASLAMVNYHGHLGFLYTMPTHRRRGLARLVLAKLTQLFEQRGYPCLLNTGEKNIHGTVRYLGYVPVSMVTWATVTPRGQATSGVAAGKE